MKLRETTVMSIITVCMVLTRFAPSKSQWKAILMVGTVRYLFCSAGFSQHLISSYKQSVCPYEADVSTLFNPQRPQQAPFTRQNWYCVHKVTTGLEGWGWISQEAQKIVREHQESISKSACLRHCKSIPPSYPSLMTYKLTTGTMGPGEVRATTHGMML